MNRWTGSLRVVDTPLTESQRRYRLLAWSVLVFSVLVILGGAVVRATGSGDGCGASWPTCTDRILPSSPTVETVIEFSHRITSALAIAGVVVLFVWARRLYAKGHRVRLASGSSLGVMVVEALVRGATLASINRRTFDEQPVSAFANFNLTQLTANLILWPCKRLGIPAEFVRQWMDNHLPELRQRYPDRSGTKTDKTWNPIQKRGTLILSLVFLSRIKQTAPSDNFQVV